MHMLRRLVVVTAAIIAPGWMASAQVPAFKPVTDALLLKPDPGDWINRRLTLDG
jgi:hypothetical protein